MLCDNIMLRIVFFFLLFVYLGLTLPGQQAFAYVVRMPGPGFKQVAPEPKSDEEFITLDHFKGHPLLVAFWRSDCAPCIAERPALNDIAHAHPDLQLVLVTLDGDTYKERHFPAPSAPNMTVLTATGAPGETLKELGDKNEGLPFSLFVSADGKICATHSGLLGTDLADTWMAKC